jgi:hypothetical protein
MRPRRMNLPICGVTHYIAAAGVRHTNRGFTLKVCAAQPETNHFSCHIGGNKGVQQLPKRRAVCFAETGRNDGTCSPSAVGAFGIHPIQHPPQILAQIKKHQNQLRGILRPVHGQRDSRVRPQQRF